VLEVGTVASAIFEEVSFINCHLIHTGVLLGDDFTISSLFKLKVIKGQ
jgi:hypothetical protein